MDPIDDSVIASILNLSGKPDEHIGAIYQDGEAFKSTPTQSTGQRSRTGGTLAVPKGSLRALFHNHPVIRARRQMSDTGGGEAFSDDDKKQARTLKVPSYILTPAGKLMKFDPVKDEVTEIPLPIRTAGAHNTLVK